MTNPTPAHDRYSPHLRTALVFGGTGTAGAYQAGVLRAFAESGVKVDVVAGCGIGAVSATFAAIDAGPALWDADGLWRSPAAARHYRWRRALRVAGWCLILAGASVILPVLGLLAGLVAYPVSLLGQVAGIPRADELAALYTRVAGQAFAPAGLPSLLPRAALLGLTAFAITLLVVHLRRRRGGARHERPAGFWWAALGAPLTAAGLEESVRARLWKVIAGAPGKREPPLAGFSQRYAELLAESLGQPGFRELVITVHDLDARRDLVFALLGDRERRAFLGRPARGIADAAGERFDLAGLGRGHLLDGLMGALAIPPATDPHQVRFAPESFWRGETHRLAARPGAFGRLLEDVRGAGAEQVVLVSAAPQASGPHALSRPRRDGMGQLGEVLSAGDAAAARDALAAARERFAAVFLVEPDHNPLDALDLRGCHDERSDRRHALGELVERGYEDAYRQFIEPVVGGGEAAADAAG